LTSGFGPGAMIAFSKVPSVPGFKFPARLVQRFCHKMYSSVCIRVEALIRSFLAKNFSHRHRHVQGIIQEPRIKNPYLLACFACYTHHECS
jgi:hypothetical protein